MNKPTSPAWRTKDYWRLEYIKESHRKNNLPKMRMAILDLMDREAYSGKDICKIFNFSVGYLQNELFLDADFKQEFLLLHDRNTKRREYFGPPFVPSQGETEHVVDEDLVTCRTHSILDEIELSDEENYESPDESKQ